MCKIEKIISENWNTIKFVTLITTLVGAFVTFDNYINNQIEEKISNENYIRRLSKSLRPFLVFDDKGIISYDHGAMKFIKDIAINEKKDKITIHTKIFLQIAPLLIIVGADQYSYTSERSGNNSWIFKMSQLNTFVLEDGLKGTPTKFILEILM